MHKSIIFGVNTILYFDILKFSKTDFASEYQMQFNNISIYLQFDAGLSEVNRLINDWAVFNKSYINRFLETWRVLIAFFQSL